MPGTLRTIVLLVALSLSVATYGLGTASADAASRPSTSAACTGNVTLEAFDSLSWSISSIADVCRTTVFTVENTGTTVHTFTVSKLANVSDPSSTDTTWFTTYELFSEQLTGAGTANATIVAKITFPNTPGSYEFTCLYHYANGMYGTIYVDESPPLPPPTVPSFTPFWYIAVPITTLAVLCIVLGMVYGKRSAHFMGIPADAPITSRPEYFNDSRPEPLGSTEPTARGETEGS